MEFCGFQEIFRLFSMIFTRFSGEIEAKFQTKRRRNAAEKPNQLLANPRSGIWVRFVKTTFFENFA
jgi:hypothetical protein